MENSSSTTFPVSKHNSFSLLFSGAPEGQLLRIELLVLFTTFIVFILFVIGCIRRCVHFAGQNLVTKALYALLVVIISYIIGLMQHSTLVHELFPIWAFFLVFAYGGVDTLTACNVGDNDNRLRYWLHTQPLAFALGTLINHVNRELIAPLVAIWLLTEWNIAETMKTFEAASKSDGLKNAIEETESHMRENNGVVDEEGANPASMKRYRYLINKHSDQKKTITTEEIWQCNGKLLMTDGVIQLIPSNPLQDVCLSVAFHKILLMKFAGLSFPKISLTQAKNFFETGLLCTEPKRMERVFHIIEVELEFVFDFFYTKFYILSKRHPCYKLKRLVGLGVCLWFAFIRLHKDEYNSKQYSGLTYHRHRVEVGVTRAMIGIFAVLEVVQFSMAIFSNWMIVRLLCNYASEPVNGVVEQMIKCIWFIKQRFSFVKPWKRKLGQYSLLESYSRIPLRRRLFKFFVANIVKVPRAGQKGGSSVTLTEHVKRAIMLSLMNNNGLELSPGTASLQRNGMAEFSYACRLHTYTEVILVWHVATTAFEFSHPRSGNDVHIHVATKLSNYCAYLVTFCCELLPDHPYVAEKVFDDTVEEAKSTFKKSTKEECYSIMENMTEEASINGVIGKGSVLANKFRNHVGENPSEGWRVLAELWAELLWFLAPSDNSTAHIEHLAQGGEFITQLWALLIHAGIVTRVDSSAEAI